MTTGGASKGHSLSSQEAGLECPCGSEAFERVVVQRLPHPPITTDFLACMGCSAMYFRPLGNLTADQQFKADVVAAARYYRKPGRKP